jgi:hypothetical protein
MGLAIAPKKEPLEPKLGLSARITGGLQERR